ncbi:MAG: hypothetical protein F6K08_24810 [Okeania sp. SIO1H6]|nr:hypothetical protein [Okeania sp. SIO1H6]
MVLYRKGKEEGRRKKEEERRKKKEERRKKKRKNLKYGKYFPNFYKNDTSGHDITPFSNATFKMKQSNRLR